MPKPPERDDLYGSMDPRDRRAMYSPEVMRAELGISGDVYDEANQYVDDELMASIPIEKSRGLRAEAIAFGRNDALADFNGGSGGGFNKAENAADWAEGPSNLSEVPTATSNPDRPRTVAAGYDPRSRVLTLVFRDGTFYNYYEVSKQEWDNFRGLPSKWEFIRNTLDNRPRGETDVSSLSEEVRRAIYQVARTAQMRSGGKTTRSVLKPKPPSAGGSAARPKPGGGGNNPFANRGKPPRPKRPKKR